MQVKSLAIPMLINHILNVNAVVLHESRDLAVDPCIGSLAVDNDGNAFMQSAGVAITFVRHRHTAVPFREALALRATTWPWTLRGALEIATTPDIVG